VRTLTRVIVIEALVICLFPSQLLGQRFLSFPLADSSSPVFHGWYYDLTWYHGAIDYKAAVGTPVFASADGIAMSSSQPPVATKDTYGTFVLVKHPNGFSTLYAHLSAVAPGIASFPSDQRSNSTFGSWTPVKRGDLIGFVGNSGTTYDHLHFEAAENNVGTYTGHVQGRVDPYDLNGTATSYPPAGAKFNGCGPNFLWLTCPVPSSFPLLVISTATCAEGGSCSSPQGTTFKFFGVGFTFSGVVHRFIQDVSGTNTELLPLLSADRSGQISWSFTSSCATVAGSYSIFAIDSTTGKQRTRSRR